MDWNSRFAAPGYLFGTAPALFLQHEAGRLSKGARVLCIADGEGRNSVFLAEQGLQVTAFDASETGLAKAQQLAHDRQAQVDYHLSCIEDWDWSQTYDAVVAIFVQFAPPDLRTRFFEWMAQAVAPGGVLLLHGYAPRQVDYGTGGPGDPSHMYTQDLLSSAFAGLEILHLTDYDAEIDEGPGHSGMSALVDLVARKPD